MSAVTARSAIGIDLGGTNIKAALIDRQTGAMLKAVSRPTCDGEFEAGVPRFALTVREIVADLEAEAGEGELTVGLSAPGLAHPDGSCITWMPGRMHGLEGFDWSNYLCREARVLNDAHAALLGEAWLGAARDVRNVFMLTLGTGVGGAAICDGRLLKGAIGRGGHLGHITVDALGQSDVFRTPGSLEAALGNQYVKQRTGGRFAATLELVEAVKVGDAAAMAMWDVWVRTLAAGVASLINVLDPELVIVGGGIAVGAGDVLFAPLLRWLDEFEWRPGGNQARLAAAELGDRAGAIGAVRFAESGG